MKKNCEKICCKEMKDIGDIHVIAKKSEDSEKLSWIVIIHAKSMHSGSEDFFKVGSICGKNIPSKLCSRNRTLFCQNTVYLPFDQDRNCLRKRIKNLSKNYCNLMWTWTHFTFKVCLHPCWKSWSSVTNEIKFM